MLVYLFLRTAGRDRNRDRDEDHDRGQNRDRERRRQDYSDRRDYRGSDEYYSRGYEVNPYYRDNQRWVNSACFYHTWSI